MQYRTKYFDPDYRRDPKTNTYCHRCQRDIKLDQPHRFMAYELDTPNAIHSEDWEIAKTDIENRRMKHLDAFIVGPIGMDCAKKIGIEYTRERSALK